MQFMKKRIGIGGMALAMSLVCAQAQTEFDYQSATGVNDSSGSPVGNGELVLLIANESGSASFNTLTAGAIGQGLFLDGSYQILSTTNTNTDFGTPGAFANSVTLNYTGTYQNLSAGDQLAVVWFTNVSASSPTLSANESYGLFTLNNSTWQTPDNSGGPAEISLTVPDGENASLETLSAVPEPGTYALIAGAAALLFAAWRRRSSVTLAS